MKPALSPDRERELLALFPHHSDADLGKRFGLTWRQVQHIGNKAGLLKTHETRSTSRRARYANGPALSVRVQAHIVAAGDMGLSREQLEALLPDEAPGRAITAVNKLTAHDLVHRAGGKGRSRWFATKAQAQAFTARLNAPARATACAPAPQARESVYIAPAPGPAAQAGAMRITAATKFTQGPPVPGPEGRWHTNAQPVFSGTGRIGRYDDNASSWVNAITERRACQ